MADWIEIAAYFTLEYRILIISYREIQTLIQWQIHKLIGLTLLPILHWDTESWSFLTVRSRPWSNGRSISCHMGVLRIGAGSSVGWQWGQVVVMEHVVGVGVPLLAQTSVWHAAQATAHWTEKEQKKLRFISVKAQLPTRPWHSGKDAALNSSSNPITSITSIQC